jgi:hypothetical protein
MTTQPKPTFTHIVHRDDPERRSIITRHWKPDDPQDCRLCSTCQAGPDFGLGFRACIVTTRALVTPERAPLFKSRKRPHSTS